MSDRIAALQRIVRSIEGIRAPLNNEAAAQRAIFVALCEIDPQAKAEVRLSPSSRIDFSCSIDSLRFGVEVKIDKGNRREIYRQLERYAGLGVLDALVLASNRAIGLPPSICGVPVAVASLGRGWL